MRALNILISALVTSSALVTATTYFLDEASSSSLNRREMDTILQFRQRSHSLTMHKRGSNSCRHHHIKGSKKIKSNKGEELWDSSSSRHRHNSTGASSSSHRFSSKGNKNGLCWANGPYVDVGKFKKSMSWLYSWSASMPLKDGKWWLPDDIQYFPMLWGKERKRIAEWKKHVLNDRHARQNKAKVAMGPNEVNQVGQGKMTPAEACDLYRKYIIPLKDEDGWYLIGPSTTSAPDGKKWTKEFKKSCPDVYRKIDADAVHYYGTNPDTAIKYIKDWHQTFGKDIWITEIGCMNFDGSGPPTLGQAYDFLKRTSNFADDADYVKGYAYYAVLEKLNINPVNRLSTVTGNPTDLFKFWVNL